MTEFLSYLKKAMLYSELLNEVQRGLISDAIQLLHRQHFRGCLYYLPMGSGKTRVGLISGLNIYPDKPILVVCSKTLLGNWVDEIQKLFGTTLQYEVLHRDYLGKRLESWRPHQNTRVILTTPEVVAKSYKDNRLEARYVEEEILETQRPGRPADNEFPFCHRERRVGPSGL